MKDFYAVHVYQLQPSQTYYPPKKYLNGKCFMRKQKEKYEDHFWSQQAMDMHSLWYCWLSRVLENGHDFPKFPFLHTFEYEEY